MLSDEEWRDLYTCSIENRKDISWIRKEVEMHQTMITESQEHINALEVRNSYFRGKVAYLAITLSALCTVVANACFWAFTHYGGAK